MLKPPTPGHESIRLQALQALAILDTPPEERFDRLTRIAQQLMQVPIALVSLVDENRQWFKSRQGLKACETSRDISFCGHAIMDTEVFVVADAAADSRFSDNPLVTAAPHIRFYAGAPLILGNGLCVGTLCAIDHQPHHVTAAQLAALRDLAQCVCDELERAQQLQNNTKQMMAHARYASIIASSDDAILSNTLDGIITSWNPAAETLFGYTQKEAIGLPVTMLIPNEFAAEEAQIIARIQQGERIEHIKTTRLKKGSIPLHVSVSISPVIDAQGNIIGASKIVRDISRREETNRALEKSAQLVQSIVETVVDGIITIDSRGTVQSFNSAAERLFGYGAAEVIGSNVKMLMPEPYAAEHDGYLAHYQHTREPRIIGIGREVVGRRKDGDTFPMDLAVSEMRQPGQSLFVGIVRDITERKRMDQMKTEFVSTVSHELRTPLTSINGALGLVCGGVLGPVTEQAKSMLDIAYKNSQRLTHLINDLLDMEKMVAGKMNFDLQTQELIPLLVQSIESTRDYAQKYQVTLELLEPLESVQVRVDGSRLQQVVSNFLSNAAKFSPRGSQVGIQVHMRDGLVRVTVIDHGPGIPAEFKDRIFQKFSQADSSDTRTKGGTGLGLAISKELIERMGGMIGFESEEGQGARFHFELPVVKVSATAQEPPALAPAGRDCILVVEDDPNVAALLVLMLERAGYSCEVASHGEMALQLLAQRPYAAMTLDLLLPDQCGVSLIRKVRSMPEYEKLPIIVVSAFLDDGQLAINSKFAAVDWLSKPIEEERLIAAVSRSQIALRTDKIKILHVEDDADLHHIVAMQGRHIGDFDLAHTLTQARHKLQQSHYDLVILDIGLPDGSGWSLLPEINALRPAPQVIVLSGAEFSPEQQRSVTQTLVKSHNSIEHLLNAIKQDIENSNFKPKEITP